MAVISVGVGIAAILALSVALKSIRNANRLAEIEAVNVKARDKEHDERTWDELTQSTDVRRLRDSTAYHYAPSYFDHKGK